MSITALDARYANVTLIALSYMLPVGEAYMVNILEQYLDDIQDPELKQKAIQFIKEERNHQAAHDKCNQRSLSEHEAALSSLLAPHAKRAHSKTLRRDRHHKHLLYVAGIEYVATALSRDVLSRPQIWLDKLPPFVRRIFVYHCQEELGHKEVAYELVRHFKAARKEELRYTWRAFLNFSLYMHASMYRLEGKRMALYGVFFWLRHGWPIVFSVLRHARKHYHPNMTDDSTLLRAKQS